jgi:glutamyl-tRNA reductase
MLEAYWKLDELHESVYTIQNLDGVRHLFRVASSLESMVLGEPQILGQLKDSFQSFSDAELTGKLLHPLFTRAFQLPSVYVQKLQLPVMLFLSAMQRWNLQNIFLRIFQNKG